MKVRIPKIQTNILVNAQTNVGKPWLDKLAQIKQKRHETSFPLGQKLEEIYSDDRFISQ